MKGIFAVVFVAAVAFLAAEVRAYGQGAPTDACADMVPQHGVPSQPKHTSPFAVKATKANGHVTIRITGSKKFKGYFVQVRDASNKPVGAFDGAGGVKTVDCAGPHTGATHIDSKDKPSVALNWKPGKFSGPAKVLATVAEDGGKFWVGLEDNFTI